MKIGFLHRDQLFATELLRELKTDLPQHTWGSWTQGTDTPAHDFEVILVEGPITRAQIAEQPKLALIQTTSAGYEGVDIDAASEMGVWVSFAPSDITGNAISVAELAVMLMLGASRHLNEALDLTRGRPVPDSTHNASLSGKSVCVVGLGGIGRLLVDRLRPFGMHISATDIHPHDVPGDVSMFSASDLRTAIAQADYVVLCVRAGKDNENLVDSSILNAMKQGSILINIARGSLVDEGALLASVRSGHIAAAGLDVVKSEPISKDNPLLALPQVLITPHIAGQTDLTLDGTLKYVEQVATDFDAGKRFQSILNEPAHPRKVLV